MPSLYYASSRFCAVGCCCHHRRTAAAAAAAAALAGMPAFWWRPQKYRLTSCQSMNVSERPEKISGATLNDLKSEGEGGVLDHLVESGGGT